MIRLSDRAQSIPPSATFALKARAAALRASGRDVIDLSVGEPDGTPPAEASAAAIAAVRAGKHRYGPVAGLPELREAIADMYRAHGLDASADHVLVTFGAKQALHHLVQVLLGPGDEVIVFAPYWVSYLPQIRLAGAVPVIVRTHPETGFQPGAAEVRAALTPRTRAILVNSPGNPTGCVIERDRLRAIDDIAREHGLVVVSDEIYDGVTYDGVTATCFPTLSVDAPDRTVIVNAISKTWAMTGWRVGWMFGPPELVATCAKLHGHTTSGVSLVNQAAALAAIRSPRGFLEPIKAALLRRRRLLADGLDAIDGIEVGPRPQGAFYLFPRVDGLFGRVTPARELLTCAGDFAEYLISEGNVGVVPGEAFGEPRCIRLSYAVDFDDLGRAIDRIAAAVAQLR